MHQEEQLYLKFPGKQIQIVAMFSQELQITERLLNKRLCTCNKAALHHLTASYCLFVWYLF